MLCWKSKKYNLSLQNFHTFCIKFVKYLVCSQIKYCAGVNWRDVEGLERKKLDWTILLQSLMISNLAAGP
jgi:hypothetical protein